MSAQAVPPLRAPLPGQYRLWVAAATVSNVGVAALYFALGWAASAHGGSAAGLVITALVGTRTVLLLVGGAIADRVGARAVMIAGDTALLVATTALAVTAAVIGTPLWLLLTAAVLEGAVTAFYLPAEGVLPRHLVPQGQVSRAVALRGSGGELADLIGGPLGGILVATAGFTVAVTVDAASYVPVLIVLVGLRGIRTVSAGPRQSLWQDARAGVTTAAREPLIRSAFALIAVTAGVFVSVGSVLVPLLVRSRHWTAATGGLLLGGLSLGAIAVTLAIARTGTARRSGPVAALGLLIAGPALTALGLAGELPVSLTAAALAGAGIALFTAHTFPVILLATPDGFLSRVQSLLSLTQAATLVAAAPLLGLAASTFGAATTLVGAGLFLTVVGVAAAGKPSWRQGLARETTAAREVGPGSTEPSTRQVPQLRPQPEHESGLQLIHRAARHD